MAEEIICNKLKYVRCHYATKDCVCTHADAKDDFCPMGKTISAGKPGTAKERARDMGNNNEGFATEYRGCRGGGSGGTKAALVV